MRRRREGWLFIFVGAAATLGCTFGRWLKDGSSANLPKDDYLAVVR
jgi:hypothetical protein